MAIHSALFLQSFFLLFIGAALLKKLCHPRAFLSVLEGYRLVPQATVPVLAMLVIALELFTVLMLAAMPFYGASSAAILLALYGIGIGINFMRGRDDFDCGCLWSTIGNSNHKNAMRHSPWLLCRNGVAVAAASGLAYLSSQSAVSIVFAGVTTSLYFAAAAIFFNLLIVLFDNFVAIRAVTDPFLREQAHV